jgi:hypothetical protein
MADGLKSLDYLCRESSASQADKERHQIRTELNSSRISNDPGLIYFRPLGDHRLMKNSIVIAVKAEAAFVFDQEHRARSDGTHSSYTASGMTLDSYYSKIESRPQGFLLNRHKGYSRFGVNDGSQYIPECAIRADKIDPQLFVHVAIERRTA